ncbi:MAG: insulinase family protein [Pseudonocardiaceae bacterium]|nr:insulinase family protein [Pseudonocardiaceae bacterium]
MTRRQQAAGTPGGRGLSRPGHTTVLQRRADGGEVRRTVLASGLRVITDEIPGVCSAAVGMWVGVGSRDERPPVAGAAHYLEHLLFKGTARRSAAQIAEEIDTVGGELNAFTAKDHTCYYAHVLDGDLDLGVDLVCDVLADARLHPADVDLERGVLLEEIAIRDDDPEDLLHDEFAAALLGSHPLGRPVLGTESSVAGMGRDALHRFYRRRYTPERMVLATAGNVAHGDVLRAVERSFGHRLHRAGQPVTSRRGRARPTGTHRLVLRTDDSEQAHLMLGVRGLDRHDERRYALGVLDAALGGGMSSRLFQQVREQRGLAYSVYSATAGYADAGMLSVYAGCGPERLGQVVAVVSSVLADMAAGGLTDAELARGKGQLRGALVLGAEDTGSRMMRLGASELHHAEHRTVEQVLERIDAVTGEQVAALARQLLRRRLTAAVVGPYPHADDLPAELRELIA